MNRKYKCVRQIDETDCGAACLATICQYYKIKADLEFVKRLAFTDKYGTNMLGLYEAALKIGFETEGLSGSLEDLVKSNVKVPYIAHVVIDNILEHYVVVLEMTSSKFIVADPAKGVVEYTKEDFNSIWTGHILSLTLNKEINQHNFSGKALISFWKIVPKYKRHFLQISLLSIGIVILNISTSFFFNYLIDSIIPNKLSLQLMSISFLLIAIHIWVALLDILRSRIISSLARYINNDIVNKYIFKSLHISYDFYTKHTTGDMVSRLQDADIVREALSQIIITAMLDFLMTILGLYILFSIHIKLFITSIFILIGYAITVCFFNKSIYNVSNELRRKESIMTSQFIEMINGIEVIKSYLAEEYVGGKIKDKTEAFMDSYKRGLFIFSKQSVLSNMVMHIGQAAVLTIGGLGVINSEISLGSLIMFYSLFFMCISPVKNMIDLMPMVHKGEVSAKRLKEIYDMREEDLIIEQKKEISLFGDIDINNITFRYGNRRAILDKCSIYIQKGERVALIGNCGSGKSTLAKVLMQLYTLESGYIKINGYDITEIPLSQLRKRIAYIPQNSVLFQGSVLENITMGKSSIEEDMVISFFHNTPIESFIQNLPAGYHTILSEAGNNISGGQKQIISFARALLKKADIFIFDEATSAVDMLTRHAIEETMEVLGRNATIIIITHQLNNLTSYDRIYKIADGRAILQKQ